MGNHQLSMQDRRFRSDFASASYPREDFDHRAHVRLAYVHLADADTETALAQVRSSLLAFLRHHGLDRSKYHETVTRAWIMAVRHFMELSPSSGSADDFIDRNPTLLNPKIMLSHYSAAVLFSPQARARFVPPDRTRIPTYPN